MKVKIEANAELLARAKAKLSASQIAAAMRMSINDSLRRGRTMVRRSVQEAYNIKASRLNDTDRRKGITTTLATNSKLTGQINVGHRPISLLDVSGNRVEKKQTGQNVTFASSVRYKNGKAVAGKTKTRRGAKTYGKGGISVEIMKGQRKTIASAFVPGAGMGARVNGSLIFARGKKGKPGFEFGKKRMPIDTISTVSVATAATNQKSLEKYVGPITEYAKQRFVGQIEKLLREVEG